MGSYLVSPITERPFPGQLALTGVALELIAGYAALCATAGGAITVNLPTAVTNGTCCAVVDSDSNAGTNNITVSGNGNTIDGVASVSITESGDAAVFVFDAGQWRRGAPVYMFGSASVPYIRIADLPTGGGGGGGSPGGANGDIQLKNGAAFAGLGGADGRCVVRAAGAWVALPASNASIVIDATGLSVGVITDVQHGNRGGGALHADVVAAGASGFMTGADKTKLNGVPAGADGDVQVRTAGALAGLGGADGTFLCRVSGAWAAGNTVDFVVITGANPATVGGLRFTSAVAPFVTSRNDANTNDLSALERGGSNLLNVGTDNALTAAKQFATVRVFASTALNVGVGAVSNLAMTSALTQIGNFPIVGFGVGNSPYGVHGRATQAMADANQTPANTIYSRNCIVTTGALTAVRDLFLPVPSSEDRTYEKTIENNCTGFGVRVLHVGGAGTTVTVPPGTSQRLSVSPSGVKAVSPSV